MTAAVDDPAVARPPQVDTGATELRSLIDVEERTRAVRRRRFRVTVRATQLVLAAAFLIGWQMAPDEGFTRPVNVSRPTEIWTALRKWAVDGVLWDGVTTTLSQAGTGFAIGLVLGGLVGVVLGSSRLLGAIFRPFIMALQAIPRLALMPLFMIWFGVGGAAGRMLVVTIVFFLVFNATYSGVLDVDPRQIEAMKTMGANRLQVLTKVTLPSVAAWLIAGLRVTVPYALIASVTAEILASNRGIGYLMQRAAGQFYTAGVMAGVLVLMVIGLLLDGVVSLLARRLLRWRPTDSAPI